MTQTDEAVLLWLNQWVGFLPWVDAAVEVLISDYFIPVLFSIIMLGLWFTGVTRQAREMNQRAVGIAAASIGLVNAWVTVINAHIFRFRPFVDHDLTLLFYRPTDSAFPANPAALAFAAASGVWLANKKVGGFLFTMGALSSAGRVYAGGVLSNRRHCRRPIGDRLGWFPGPRLPAGGTHSHDRPAGHAEDPAGLTALCVLAVAILGEVVLAPNANVPPLVDVDDELLPGDANRVHDLLVKSVNEVLNPLLGQTLANGQRAMHHARHVVQVNSPYRRLVLQDGVHL